MLFFIALSAHAENPKWKTFAEIEVGYKLGETKSDSYEFCRAPATFSAGLETKKGTAFGLRHVSNYDCGRPLNDRDEYYSDQVFFRFKFGGH